MVLDQIKAVRAYTLLLHLGTLSALHPAVIHPGVGRKRFHVFCPHITISHYYYYLPRPMDSVIATCICGGSRAGVHPPHPGLCLVQLCYFVYPKYSTVASQF